MFFIFFLFRFSFCFFLLCYFCFVVGLFLVLLLFLFWGDCSVFVFFLSFCLFCLFVLECFILFVCCWSVYYFFLFASPTQIASLKQEKKAPCIKFLSGTSRAGVRDIPTCGPLISQNILPKRMIFRLFFFGPEDYICNL